MSEDKSQIGFLQSFSVLAGAFSVFSMLQRGFDFGVGELLIDFANYYRELGGWLFAFVNQITFLNYPAWYYDFWILSCCFTTIALRSSNEEGELRDLSPLVKTIMMAVLIPVIALAFPPLILMGIPIFFALINVRFGFDYEGDFERYRNQSWLFVAAVCGFFALNAYGPLPIG